MARTVDTKKRLDLAYQAFEVVVRKGLLRTTLTEVARELEMKRTTLYWYFQSIGQIVIEVLQDIEAQEKAHMDDVLEGVEDVVDILLAKLHGYYAFYQEKELFLTLVFQLDGDDLEPGIQAYMEQSKQKLMSEREEIAKLLQEGVQAGALHPHHSEQLSDATLSYILGVLLHGLDVPIDGHALIDLFAQGLILPLRVKEHGSPPTLRRKKKRSNT